MTFPRALAPVLMVIVEHVFGDVLSGNLNLPKFGKFLFLQLKHVCGRTIRKHRGRTVKSVVASASVRISFLTRSDPDSCPENKPP
jgi:hypothetical protein